MINSILAEGMTTLAALPSATHEVNSFVVPAMRVLVTLASLVCAGILIAGGIFYTSSNGNPENLAQAKKIIKNALLGLVIVIGAAALTQVLSSAYPGTNAVTHAAFPELRPINPLPSNGLVDAIAQVVLGFLNMIVQIAALPFMGALSFFTSGTPLMADNSVVFKLWLAVVGIADALFVLVVALVGFQVMGASTLGFDEIEFKHILPRLGVVFLLMNSSIFLIDAIIQLSNAMIRAVNLTGAATGVWSVLTDILTQPSALSIPAMLIMVTFLIFAVILILYYLGRLIELYIGAVLSPIVLLCWLVPGLRDISETAAKAYLMVVFVLFVHVVILEIAGSLLAGLVVGDTDPAANGLMAMLTGLAALIALLKTQGFMMQLSYAGSGMQSSRKIATQFTKLTVMTATSAYKKTMAANEALRNKPVTVKVVKDQDNKKADQTKGSNQGTTHSSIRHVPKVGATIQAPNVATNKATDKQA